MSTNSQAVSRHTIFQNSLMTALLDGIYDGELTIGDILAKGNFGLGTFDLSLIHISEPTRPAA